MTAPPAAPEHRPFPRVLVRRVAIALALAVLIVVPALIMVLATRLGTGHVEGAATWASMPAIIGIAVVAVGGASLGARVAVVVALLAPLSIVAGQSPVAGAALMALMCLSVGYTARFGLNRATMLVPVFIAWTIIDPPVWGTQATLDRTDTSYLVWMAAIFLVGAIFPVIVGPFLLRKVHLPPPKPHPRSEAVPYTVIITVLTTVSTYYVLDHTALYGGGFLVAAILVLTPLGATEPLRPTLYRVAGTLLGAIVVIPIILNVSSLTLIYLIGVGCGIAAVAAKFSPRAWIYYALIVPTSACLNAVAVPQVRQLGEQRVIDNVVGAVLVLLAVACSIGFSRLRSNHHGAGADPEESARVSRA